MADTRHDYVTALAADLTNGISADIWFDPKEGDGQYAERIELTQNAMLEAATLLPILVNDLNGVLGALARLREAKPLSADDEAADAAFIEAAQARVETMLGRYEAEHVDMVQPRPF